MAAAAGRNRDAKTAGPLARRLRDLVMPLGVRLFFGRATAWLYTHDCGALPPPAPRAATPPPCEASGGRAGSQDPGTGPGPLATVETGR